jgi:2-polyprenyl-6-hydroxyphenyl methylase/3-demethylubiquinone-9 3-methyltransferase
VSDQRPGLENISTLAGTFYEVQSPAMTLELYLRGCDNLYDKTRIQQTKSFLEKNLDLQSMTVLDVGCGGGLWTAYFAKTCRDVIGVDVRPHVVDAAKLYLGRLGLAGNNVRLLAGCTPEVVQHCDFDLIFLKDVIEHIEDDVAFLRSLLSLLGDDGRIYISTQNRNSLNYLIEGGYRVLLGQRHWLGWDPTHLRFYSPRSLSRLLAQSELVPIRWHSSYHIPYRFVSRRLSGKVHEYRVFHLVEVLFGDKPVFNKTGWAIGVLAGK